MPNRRYRYSQHTSGVEWIRHECKRSLGPTPIHPALREGYNVIAEALINGGANVDTEDHSGETPLQIACDKGSSAILDLILGKSSIAPYVRMGNIFNPPESHTDGRRDAITLRAGPGGQESLQWTDRDGTEVCDFWDARWVQYSVFLLRYLAQNSLRR